MKKKLFLFFIVKKIILLLVFLCFSHSADALEITLDSQKIINYLPNELKFYDITDNQNNLLNKKEVSDIYPEYKIILVSEFDKNRKYILKNSLFKTQKILLLNDTKRTFHGFEIFPLTSRDENQAIKSLITVYGKKNVRLKHPGGDEFEIVVR